MLISAQKVARHNQEFMSEKRIIKSFPAAGIARLIRLVALASALSITGLAQEPDQSKQQPEAPIEHADELKTKITLGVYFLSDDRNYDINLRHQFGHVLAWVAGFIDPKGDSQGRIGAEYDFQRKWLLFIPTLEVGSNGALAGSVY